MSDFFTRYVAMEEELEKIKTDNDELKKMLDSAMKDLRAEREARIKAENDLKVANHDHEEHEKRITELQEKYEKEKRRRREITVIGAKMAAKCDAAEAARDAYKAAFEAALKFGETLDDE